MNLLDSLLRWNLWGSWKITRSFKRDIIDEICRYTDTEEVIALIGPRRAGKSTLLYQVMNHLLANGISDKAILHVNFEEPGLSPYLALDLLDKLYELYRSRVYPTGKAYIFFDEIQNVPEWERWVRARNDLENIKIFITGSSSALLSGELATVLSGRNFCFDVYPLSFKEVLAFKGIPLPSMPLPIIPPPEIHYALNEYLHWGGFPRVVLARDDEERSLILKRYFDEILFKDIIERYEIRNTIALKNIAVHLLTNTSTLITIQRMADIFQVSQDLVQSYMRYLSEAFMIALLPFYSLKASERTRHPMKVHAIDLGLRNISCLSSSADNAKLIETIVHNTLLRKKQGELFYWKGEREIDLLTQHGNAVTGLYQVAFTGLDQKNVAEREFMSLQKAAITFPQAKQYIISMSVEDVLPQFKQPDIALIPLWQFLLA